MIMVQTAAQESRGDVKLSGVRVAVVDDHESVRLGLRAACIDAGYDFVLAACLLYGAWRTAKDIETGRPWLAAAWGVTCGMAYTSFFGQLVRLDEADPAPIPATWVVGIKGAGFLLAILALAGSLRHARVV